MKITFTDENGNEKVFTTNSIDIGFESMYVGNCDTNQCTISDGKWRWGDMYSGSLVLEFGHGIKICPEDNRTIYIEGGM